MHIRPDQFASASALGCKNMRAQQFFIFSQRPSCRTVRRLWPREQLLCAPQHARGQAAFKYGRDPARKIALNPYKLAILLQ
jgi:hypothetical protein